MEYGGDGSTNMNIIQLPIAMHFLINFNFILIFLHYIGYQYLHSKQYIAVTESSNKYFISYQPTLIRQATAIRK